MEITLAHSPDSDDAFMFYGLASGRIDTHPYRIRHILKDIESLNHDAVEEKYDLSAISLSAFPFVSHLYELLPYGASVGDNYGPMLVSKEPLTPKDFVQKFSGSENPHKIGVPGERTTAFLVLKILLNEFSFQCLSFDKIIPAVIKGEVDAGLLIHEGQLNYAAAGLVKILDLGTWWREETHFPLPLGANVIRKSLKAEDKTRLAQLVRKSIEFSLSEENREAALNYSLQFARGLDATQTERFVRMYVNQRALDLDEDTIQAMNLLYNKAASLGIMPKQKPLRPFQV
jgi:1,4-dihydroxy-6-naphthoate synthase